MLYTKVCNFNEKNVLVGKNGGVDEDHSGNTVLIMSLIRPSGGHLHTKGFLEQEHRDDLPKMVNRR